MAVKMVDFGIGIGIGIGVGHLGFWGVVGEQLESIEVMMISCVMSEHYLPN